MAIPTRRGQRRNRKQTSSTTVKPIAVNRPDEAVSPMDFYREMVTRPDVRRILARLAQGPDDRARR
jgi:hypothetical protein